MIRRDRDSIRTGGSGIAILLLALALLLGAASEARAQACSDYGGLLDGFAGDIPPAQLQIDQNCVIKNYPASNPLSTNFSFYTQPGQNPDRWLIVFDNVVHVGQMSCNSVLEHKIWFVNGSSSSIQNGCQNLLIPVEKIDKANPDGQTTAAVGVPFTYTLTLPTLFDPATGTVVDYSGTANDLHGVTLWDDLDETGVDLVYLDHVAYWRDDQTAVPHTFSNVGGLLTFDDFPIIPTGKQIVIEITVVLEDTATNAPGTEFVNTARWDFGRLIEGVFYEPLPGEWGISPPLKIAAPELVVTKTGPASLGRTLNLGEWGEFTLDVQNTGPTDAWNTTLLDQLPDEAAGGMCDMTPQVPSARIFEEDGSTPVSAELVEGTDYSLSYAGAPTCELTLTLLTAAGPIGPNQRLIVTYRTQLDADTQDDITLTNVAGAIEWFNGDPSNADRLSFTRELSDGTPDLPDHEDAHTVTTALYGFFFEKTVANLVTGVDPITTAIPGDRLRYTLRLQTTDLPLDGLSFYDDLGELNAGAVFVPESLALVTSTLPPGADDGNTDSAGGTNGAGILDIRNLSVPANSEIRIQFDITLDPNLEDGTVVLNQADLIRNAVKIADSDDPNIDGQADPSVAGDEDPTRVVISSEPVGPLLKANTQESAAVGVPFRYRVTVPETTYPYPIYDVRITDDLTESDAVLRFLDVTKVSGSEPWSPVNTGTDTDVVIEDPDIGIDIPAGEQVVLDITVVLADTSANTPGLSFTNTASFLYDRIDDDDSSQRPGSPGASEPMTIVEPALTLEKTGPAQMTVGTPETFALDVHNPTDVPAWNLTIVDRLPDESTGGSCDGAPSVIAAEIFEADRTTSVSGPLVQGTDFDASFLGRPDCLLTVTLLSAASVIGPDQHLLVSYQTELDADSQTGAQLTNIAGATQWYSADGSSSDRRVFTRELSDGTVDVLDHEDAHTVEALANVPSLFAAKDVTIFSDAQTPNAVDPGDVLLYTITVENNGVAPATGVTLTDGVPANTTYVAGSMTLNNEPVGQPDNGVSPLVAGIPISSSDLTLPLPGPGEGTLTPGETAVIQFRLRVDDDVPGGTVISNQAVVGSAELPDVLTDGDGDPDTGPEPTVVVVSDGQQLLITKQVSVVGGGPALAGSVLEYVVTVLNLSIVPAFDVLIVDDLEAATPGYLGYVDASATMDGSTTGVSFLGSVLTAAYSASNGPLQPGQSVVLRFQAVIDPNLALGTTVTNVGVVTWNDPQETSSASVSLDVGGTPGVGTLNGAVWHDADFDDFQDELEERPLEGWSVALYHNGQPEQSVLTDADGKFSIGGVAPNDQNGDQYELRFSAPGAGINTAALGLAHSDFTDGLQQITEIIVPSGANLLGLDLPIDPNGVVYDAVQRVPIAGATLSMLNANGGTLLPPSCFEDPAQQGQVTLADGFYKFDLQFDTACPSGDSYVLAVAPPGSGYIAGYSELIPPTTDPAGPPFSVPPCAGSIEDAVPATADHCEMQLQATAPSGGESTRYHVHLLLDASQVPGSSQLFNNHIPLDPALDGAVTITKSTPSLNVSRGSLVPYEITIRSELSLDLLDVRIVDRFPAGFHYVDGSARIEGESVEPTVDGRELVFTDIGVGDPNRRTLTLLLAVGAGVSEGKYVNRAQAFSDVTGEPISGEASATVRVVPDPTFSCTDAIGKVFDDANRNGVQDPGEPGLPGVRLVTVRGLAANTDQAGRYHITCAAVPNETRGSNFVLKLDERSLPSGYRLSTRRTQVQRASAGKALRLNFAASIHRVVSLDLADSVFEPDSTQMRVQWRPRIELLIDELKKSPATLRLAYVADVEDADLVEERLDATRDAIVAAWGAMGGYELEIESEVFWRKGAPAKRAFGWKRRGWWPPW